MDRLQESSSGSVDFRLPRLRANHSPWHCPGYGPDSTVCCFPIPIYGTIWVLLIAYVTRFIPYGMRTASGSILQIHSELEEAAAASGASWWETFKRVTLPLLRPGFAAGWIYICIVSFREFSTSVLLATGESRVLSILLFTMFEQGQVTVVAAIGVLMIATLLAIVAVFYKISGRVG